MPLSYRHNRGIVKTYTLICGLYSFVINIHTYTHTYTVTKRGKSKIRIAGMKFLISNNRETKNNKIKNEEIVRTANKI